MNRICEFSFYENENITEYTIPEGVQNIGEFAFANCTNLERIIIPNSVTFISNNAFSGCTNLKEVILPNKLETISFCAFCDCKSLKRIVIPDSVKIIWNSAFMGCSSLSEVVLPDTDIILEHSVFSKCTNLVSINIPSKISNLPDYLFSYCKKLNIALPDTVKKIGSGTFLECSSLTKFPTSVESFGFECFAYCKRLDNVVLNKNVKSLPVHMFKGCRSLKNISYLGDNLEVSEGTFKNCGLTEIPSFIVTLKPNLFEKCNDLRNIRLNYQYIPKACFKDCKNLVSVEHRPLIWMGEEVFSGCSSLEDFDASTISNIPERAFKDCVNLRSVYADVITSIDDCAFENCRNLEFKIPFTVKKIGKKAFLHCNSIKEIDIHVNLEEVGSGAFAYMNSLEKFNGHSLVYHPSDDGKVLINIYFDKVVAYACANLDKSYSLVSIIHREGTDIIVPIRSISKLAFAGASHLEELEIPSCLDHLNNTTFEGCPNLRKLKVNIIPFYSSFVLNQDDQGYLYSNMSNTNPIFKELEFEIDPELDNAYIGFNGDNFFDKLEKLTFPSEGHIFIKTRTFDRCKKLKEVYLPNSVVDIQSEAVNRSTRFIFDNGIETKNLKSVEIVKKNNKVKYKLITVFGKYDYSYYIEDLETGEIYSFDERMMKSSCKNSGYIVEKPVLLLDYINDLKKYNLEETILLDGALMNIVQEYGRDEFFKLYMESPDAFINYFNKSGMLTMNTNNMKSLISNYSQTILNGKLYDFAKIAKLLYELKIDNQIFYDIQLPYYLTFEEFRDLITYDTQLVADVFDKANVLHSVSKLDSVLKNNNLLNFIKSAKECNKTYLLMNEYFVGACDNPFINLFVKYYDANMKRLIRESKYLSSHYAAVTNFNDLLYLLEITGCFLDNDIKRQQAMTFVTEKLFLGTLDDGSKNNYQIVGDNIHRIFSIFTGIPILDNTLTDGYDEEFADFFRNNYKEIIAEEKIFSGFIRRIYFNFVQISKSSTSNKGNQRHLRVTLDKCKRVLADNKFDGVNDSNKELAYKIGYWFDNNTTWENALRIVKEANIAPRNIFTKVDYDKDGNVIYDYDEEHDLEGKIIDGFSYHWLPKQSYDNLLLGKYCNCCAHLEGAGSGIMRASIILDCTQNLVIRNQDGIIISKATLYINKEKGYGVFNTIETNINYHNDNDILKKIYDAYMRGIKDFVKVYNLNNPNNMIHEISVGANRNTLLSLLNEYNVPKCDIKQGLQFGEYALQPNSYDGDWKNEQRLLLKK